MTYIKRTIRFYKFDNGLTEGFKPVEFDPKIMLQKISTLKGHNRYLDFDDRRTCCVVDKLEDPFQIRLANIRVTDFPSVEENGEIKELDLPKNAGLFETIHVVFFPNNVVGFDSNFYGPRITRLTEFFQKVTKELCPKIIYLEPLINPKIIEQLANIKSLTLFKMKINAAYVNQVFDIDEPLGSVFKSLRNLGNADEIELILKVTQDSKTKLLPRLLNSTRKMIKDPVMDQNLSKLLIKGFDETLQQNVELDLLNDKIIASKQILKMNGRTKTLDPKSAYKSIINSYNELEEKISLAASLRL